MFEEQEQYHCKLWNNWYSSLKQALPLAEALEARAVASSRAGAVQAVRQCSQSTQKDNNQINPFVPTIAFSQQWTALSTQSR